MSRGTLSIEFAPQYGDSEARWIRLEPVEPASQLLTTAQAAAVIDALYQTSPCVTGTGGTGGEAASEPISEEDFLSAAKQALDLSVCAPLDYWTAQVDVLRSHQTPGYRMESETASVSATETRIQTRTETAQLSGAVSYDLQYPYHSGLQVTGAARVLSVRGSTINFAAPVQGSVQITYQTVFDRVTLRVPCNSEGSGEAAEADNTAGLLAFWADLAAQTDVRRQEQETVDATERDRICNASSSSHGQIGGDCWQTVEHYYKCNCSGSEAPGAWQETVSAPCPDGRSGGSHVGMRRVLAGYVYCEGEKDEVSDPEYYEKTCCEPPPKSLPRCKRTYSLFRGGEPIAHGADYYRGLYGANVVLTAISPPEGICGEEIREWDTSSKDCCDDIIPLSPHPDNPTEFRAGEAHWIEVLDGKPGELIWTAQGGLYFWTDRKVHTIRTPSRRVLVYAESEGTCPEPSINVDDKCKPLEMRFVGGGANQLELPYDDLVIAPEERFVLQASGGVPPMRWQIGGQIKLISWDQETGRSALFEASEDFCGTEDITIIDTCGDDATVTVRSTKGRWEQVTDFDPYSAPWSGTPTATPQAAYYRVEYGGYRADLTYNQFSANFIRYPNVGHPHLGSCQETLGYGTYTGRLLAIIDGISPIPCTPEQGQQGSIDSGGIRHYAVYCYGMCANYYTWIDQGYRTYESRNNWFAQYQSIVFLWKWVCPDGSSTQ